MYITTQSLPLGPVQFQGENSGVGKQWRVGSLAPPATGGHNDGHRAGRAPRPGLAKAEEPTMHEDRKPRLDAFVGWVGQHIKGDEKGEAQIFLDRLFAAFGRKGVKEAGATLEERVKKADNRGTAFADLVFRPIVLIEMKRRGEDLTRHYRQAFDYWTRLVPGRPRYVVLCNFDEFWVYDFQTQMDSPVDQLALAEPPNRYGLLAFLAWRAAARDTAARTRSAHIAKSAVSSCSQMRTTRQPFR